ncbi:YmdB family metallophosphoesterase [Amycolatopsis sp. H20-H5]|uniref:YmdB family metallophosphoesterase n=1 Tax=Amycolatopsis sp. H20-H5 TaxID=3046309 RepID=UPI002DBC9610|nr:YmdB family metallophosphoesterase [Amycolatopsis sp. H20-H5]MEC3980508.1 YmdB family metallophosphoesterase [Amycolatopsis sp. H20-H5]
MIVLFFGDVVGQEATEFLIKRLQQLRDHYRADLVIANAENSAPDGLGTTAWQADSLLAGGVDVITGGNHSWDSPESVLALDNPRVLRPLNLTEGVPGRGSLTLDVGDETVTVINLADACAMKSVRAAAGRFVPAYQAWTEATRTGTVIVDYHGDHVLEKQIFARTVDGAAAAVLGTHTHEATLPLHVLPGGTAFVTDVGMTGPTGGVQGFGYDVFVAGMRSSGNPFEFGIPRPISGPIVLGAVLMEIEHGKTVRLERLS